jgi:polyhydroxybutyrate depolymerase
MTHSATGHTTQIFGLILGGWAALLLACSSSSGDESTQLIGSGGTSAQGGSAQGGSAEGGTAQAGSAQAGAVSGGQDSGGTSAGGAPGGNSAGGSSGAAVGGEASGGASGAAGVVEASGDSAGCGTDITIVPGDVTLQTLMVDGVEALYQSREFYIRLPLTYDPQRAYPLILLGHGCGGNGQSVIPIHQESGEDAIVVGLSSVEDCFATSGGVASPEFAFFDAVLADMSSRFCIDTGKVFVAGFSSGAWLSNLLGCGRGDKIRGIGTMAGGLGDSIQGHCVGHIAAMMMADTDDTSNPIVAQDDVTGIEEGSGAAHTLTAERNGCSIDMTPWDAEFPECQINSGCDPAHPVVWCVTSGKGHSDQVPMSTVGLWRFWSSLP